MPARFLDDEPQVHFLDDSGPASEGRARFLDELPPIPRPEPTAEDLQMTGAQVAALPEEQRAAWAARSLPFLQTPPVRTMAGEIHGQPQTGEEADIEKANKLGAPQVDFNKQTAPYNLREHIALAQGRPTDKLQYWAQRIPWSPAGIIQPLEVKASADRISTGVGEPKDFEKLADFIVSAERQQKAGIISKAVDITTALPAFAAEFAATGGIFSAGRAAAQKAGFGAIEEAAKAVTGKVARYAATKAAEAPAFVAGAAAQTLANPKLIAQNFAENELNRVKFREGDVGQIETIIKEDDKGFETNLRNAFVKAGFDVGTEYAGELLHPLKAAIAARWLNGVAGRTPGKLQKALDASGWHGVLGEMFEERLNEFAAPLYGENYQPPTPQQLAAEALAFSVPGLANRVLSGPAPHIEKGPPNATTQGTEQPRLQRGEANVGVQPVGENRQRPPEELAPRAEDQQRNRVPVAGELQTQEGAAPGTPVATPEEVQQQIAQAEAQTHPAPSEAQKEAGNYPKGKVTINGLDISIENPKGSVRSGTDAQGKPWQVTMPATYGYILGTEGKDKDHLDVYLGPIAGHAASTYIVNQADPKTGKFDEHKVLYGFPSAKEAMATYDAAFSDGSGPTRGRSVVAYTEQQFQQWLKDGNHKVPAPKEPTLPPPKATFVEEPAKPFLTLGQSDTINSRLKYAESIGAPVAGIRNWFNEVTSGKVEQQPGYHTTLLSLNQAIAEHQRKLKAETNKPPGATIPPVAETKPPVGETGPREGETLAQMKERIMGPPKDASQEVVLARLKDRLLEAKGQIPQSGGFHASGVWFDLGINYPGAGQSYISGRGITINVPTEDLKRGDLSKAEILIGGKKTQIEDIAANLPKVEKPAISPPAAPPVSAPPTETTAIPGPPETAAVEKPKAPKAGLNESENARLKELQEKLRKKFGNTYTGIDPEILQIGAEMASLYVKSGVRKFAAFARDVKNDLPEIWDKLKSHLRSIWEAAAVTNDGLDEPTRSQAKAAIDELDAAKAPVEVGEDEIRTLIDSNETTAQKSVKMRQMAEAAGIELKAMQERVEAVLVKMASEIAHHDNLAPKTRFDMLVELYNRQPLFSARTSTSVENQAYSTPAPIAFALRHMTGVSNQTAVYDATAGNGMLLLGAKLGDSVANEINPQRAQALRDLGVGTVTENDATKFVPNENVPVVHLNPPFGSIPNENYDGYAIRKLEHLIALKGLEAMDDDGRAAIILGANLHEKEQGKGAQWVFENYLYGHYNVVDNFEINGDLYAKQGAKFPVRVLVIAGRKATPLTGEFAPKTVDRLNSWDEVWARAERARNEAERIRSSLGPGGQGPIPPGVPTPGGTRPPTGHVPAGPSQTPAPTGGGGLRHGAGGGKPATPAGPAGGGTTLAPTETTEGPGNAPGAAGQPGVAGEPTAPVEGRSSSGTEDAVPPSAGSTEAGGGTEPGVVPKPPAVAATETQIPYVPRAEGYPFGTLTPSNIGSGTHAALDALVGRVGPLTPWVADRLNFTTAELQKGMSADQIDSVALAIDQIQNGGALIVGHETGIGKGRIAAAIIRFAHLLGKIPIFFTKDPKLFTDMYGDLLDIGTTLRPLIFGDPSKASIVDENGNVIVQAPTKARQDQIMADVQKRGLKAAGYDAIFSTYSQVNIENARQRFLEGLTQQNDSILILDEAHEAAGDGSSSMQAAFMQGGQVRRGSGSEQTTVTKMGLLRSAGTQQGRGGVTYLSATYAKRPDNMPLYFRTALSKAAQSFGQIVEAMKKGGVALQQAVSEALAAAGQYVRLERDFSGVKYELKKIQVADERKLVEQVDGITDLLGQIVEFSHQVRDAAKANSDATSTAMSDNAIDVADFAALVHNQVGQLLLAAKADEVVKEAVEAHQRGEKPVIALMNTMESFLDQYTTERNIKPGQPIQLRWHELLKYALSRTLRGKIKQPNGDTVIVQLTPEELGLKRQFDAIVDQIGELETEFPVSPIDYITQEMEKRGVKTGELTGRESGINYTDVKAGTGTYKRFKKANKNTLVNGFNSSAVVVRVNEQQLANLATEHGLAALLLNASGSTGLSIHASEKFRNKQPRHMIIAQPALDINVFVQTLGRIKRTGMVLNGVNPDGSKWGARYTHLVLPLQAEMRPAAVTNRKMKSLNANTTAESKSGVKIESADFLNKYGDEVVTEFLEENPEWQPRLGLWVDHNNDGTVKVEQDVARKFTGRMSLMPDAEQAAAYNQVIPAYNEMIERLKTTGEYDLDIVVHSDWDGVQQSDDQLAPGTDESSIFTASVRAQRWEITDNRHVPTGEEMQEEFQRQTGGADKLRAEWDAHVKETEKRLATNIKVAEEALQKALADHNAEPTNPAHGQKAYVAQNDLIRMQEVQDKWAHTKDTLNKIVSQAGEPVELTNAETHETFDGMMTSFKMPNLARGVRVSPSAFHVRYLVDSPGGKMFLRGSMFNDKGWSQSPSERSLSDFKGAKAGQRYARWVVTGNPIKAYDATGGRGKMVRFKTRDGQTVTGLIMPVKWDISKLASDPRLELVSGNAIANFLRAQRGQQNHAVENKSGIVRFNRTSSGNYGISVPAAKRTGGDYYLDAPLRKIVGDFTKSGARMIAEVDPEKLAAAGERVMQIAGERLRVAGKLSPAVMGIIEEANRPGATASDVANKIAEALEKLKSRRKPGDVQAFGIVPLVWDQAISIAQGVIRAGGKVADAVAKAIEHIRANFKGEWDEVGARQALEAAAVEPEKTVTTEEGETVPAVDEHWVPTQVKGKTWWVRGRDQLTPESTARSITAAESAFDEAGLEHQQRTMLDVGDRQTKSILFVPRTENADAKGAKLAEVLEREIRTQREDGKGADHVAVLINSIREGFDQAGSAFEQMSQQVRNRLFALAQEEASWRGRALRALANSKADIIRVSRNVDVYLQRIYAKAFTEDRPGATVGATDIADDLRTALREVLTEDEVNNLSKLIKDPAQKERIRAALEKVLEKVRAEGQRRLGRKNWRSVESLIEGGILDDTEWFKDLARKRGWKVPTDAQIEEMRKLANEEQALRQPTEAELKKAGDDPLARERLLADIEAATRESRFKLQKRLAVMWSEMTKPVSMRNYWANRQNNARFLNELMTANLLFRASFAGKQAIDVGTQWLWRMPMRAVAQALTLRKNDAARGNQSKFWQDAQAAMADIYGDSLKSFKVAASKARAALAGRVEIRNVDRLMSGISALDRLWLKGERAAEDGRNAEAFLWRTVAAIGFSYKVAGAFDLIHGIPAEWNERRFRVIEALRENGLDPAAARVQAQWVMDGALAEYPEAVTMTRSMLEARGIPFTEQQLKEDAWNMVERRQYQRISELGLPVDAIQEQSELYRQTLGWNEREMRGIGGIVGGVVSAIGRGFEHIGVPMAMGRFGNAIAIGINRQLHRTPLYELADLPFMPGSGRQPSPWSRTMTDIYERRLEAVAGTALGGTLLAMAAAGAVKVWLRPPPDKEERDLWDREGHKSGTVEIPLGDGRYSVWSLTAGPFALVAPYLAAGGAINDLAVKREKAQAKLDADAARKGLVPAKLPSPDIADWFGVAVQAAQGAILGNRTASGLFYSITDYGTPNVKKFVASQLAPLVPGLPALQEVSRMAGVIIDPKKADIGDFFLPLPTSKARKYNMLGDPVGTQSDIQRIIQTLTGGTYPSIRPGDAHDADAYKALFATGYRPPSVDPNAAHAIGGEMRPFTPSELERYTEARSRHLKDELASLGPTADAKDAKAAYQRANAAALQEVGVTPARAQTAAGGRAARGAGPSGGVGGVPVRTAEARAGSVGGAVRRGLGRSRLGRGLRGARLGRRGLARASRIRLQPSLRGRRGRVRGLSRVR